MGGHGGLNILPQVCFHSQHTIAEREHHKDSNQQQKSWHVYGRENRNKVARDEAKHAEEQKAQDEKHQQAEREFKRSLLLSRAQAKYGTDQLATGEGSTAPHSTLATETPSTAAAQLGDKQHSPAHHAAWTTLVSSGSPTKADLPENVPWDGAASVPRKLEHINFFRKEELKQKHDEEEAERRAAKARRGNPETQTSDARFDEQFQFAHRMRGDEARPWYAKRARTLADAAPDAAQPWAPVHGHLPTAPGAVPSVPLLMGNTPDSSTRASSPKHKKRKKSCDGKKKSKKKKKKKSKHRTSSGSDSSSKEEGHGPSVGDGRGAAKSVAVLRQERMAREAAERGRQQAAVQDNLTAAGVPLSGGRYHNSFGNAAHLPHKRA